MPEKEKKHKKAKKRRITMGLPMETEDPNKKNKKIDKIYMSSLWEGGHKYDHYHYHKNKITVAIIKCSFLHETYLKRKFWENMS